MKLPSLYTLWSKFLYVIARFPFQCFIVLVATGLWISTTFTPLKTDREYIHEIILLCNLAFTLSLSANLYSASRNMRQTKSLLLQVLALLPPLLLFIFLDPRRLESDGTRVLLSLLAGHLLVSLSISSNRRSVFQFWSFNKALFLRFLTGILFSIILYAGISVALMSVQTLFSYRFDGEVFFRLFILTTAGFNSIFFLAGIPDLSGDEAGTGISSQTGYPKILKIFSQYVLLPLLTIYFGILIVYELKIAFSFELPKGTVSYLVLGYSVLGILAYLLVYPLKDSSGDEWVRYFSKLFFWLMIPLLILLFIAIGVRVSEYGLTDKRYLIIAMAIWLSTQALYFSIARKPRLELIPLSLSVMLVISIVGPQNVSRLSRLSQQARLQKLMSAKDPDLLAQKESVVRYLTDYHGLPSLQAFTDRDLVKIQRDIHNAPDADFSRWQKKEQLRDSAFSILHMEPTGMESRPISFSATNKLINSGDFNFVYWLAYPQNEEIRSEEGNLRIISDQSVIHVEFPDKDTLSFDLGTLMSQLRTRYNDPASKHFLSRRGRDDSWSVPDAWLVLKDSSSRHSAEIRLQHLYFLSRDTTNGGGPLSANGFLLIR